MAAIIIPAIFNPSHAPLANEWRKLAARCSSSSGTTITSSVVKASCSSGKRSLLIANDDGIDMTQEETRAWPFSPRPMYARRTDPAMVAKPDVMIWWISARVRCATNGLISMADSPWPMNGDAAATTASAPDTRIDHEKNTAHLRTHHCSIPQ